MRKSPFPFDDDNGDSFSFEEGETDLRELYI